MVVTPRRVKEGKREGKRQTDRQATPKKTKKKTKKKGESQGPSKVKTRKCKNRGKKKRKRKRKSRCYRQAGSAVHFGISPISWMSSALLFVGLDHAGVQERQRTKGRLVQESGSRWEREGPPTMIGSPRTPSCRLWRRECIPPVCEYAAMHL